MISADQIKTLAKQFAKDVVQIRRHIHANPELSFQEFETAKYVAEQLRALVSNLKKELLVPALRQLSKEKIPNQKQLH